MRHTTFRYPFMDYPGTGGNLVVTGTWASREITVDGEPLIPDDPSTGFSWGDEGAGAAQLAFAILLRFADGREHAELRCQAYKVECIAKLPKADFQFRGRDVLEFLLWMDREDFAEYQQSRELMEELRKLT